MFASEKSIPNFQLDNGCVNISKALNIITPWLITSSKETKIFFYLHPSYVRECQFFNMYMLKY